MHAVVAAHLGVLIRDHVGVNRPQRYQEQGTFWRFLALANEMAGELVSRSHMILVWQFSLTEDIMTKITNYEREVLKAIVASDFHDGNDPIDNWVWSFSGNPWEDTPESRRYAGVLVSLIRKGLAKQSGEGRDACVAITADGHKALEVQHG